MTWRRLFLSTITAAYFYVFMEWIFFISMPSFMNRLSIPGKVEVFLLSGFTLALICTALMGAVFLLDTIAVTTRLTRLTPYIAIFIPAAILSALALLLIDNFTYTIFKFGVSTSTGVWRGVYGIGFTILLVYIYVKLMETLGVKRDETGIQKTPRWLIFIPMSLMAISAILVLARLDHTGINPAGVTPGLSRPAKLPNILLLGSDGMNADFFSAYGYEKDTTPIIRELAKTSLVAENTFTNSGNTAGSVISIMTSKLPTQTRLLYPPDILSGVNAYQHLPGMLKSEGYQTIELGSPFYVDAFSFNLQEGFDRVNNHSANENPLSRMAIKVGFENTAYFSVKVIERISERIQHIFYIREMHNPYSFVSGPVANIKDAEKITQLLSAFDQTESPLFIHAHLLGTHGGYYSPRLRVFSKGEKQSQPWMTDYYADSILTFDLYVGEVIDHLKASGEWENTILIIYTDHNQQFKVDQRIPLIIHFPYDEFAGRITSPVQNIDIAPTILDYLDISQPEWMTGTSLLHEQPGQIRLIFSMGTHKIKQNEYDINFLDPNINKPPFYQFSYITVIDCQKWYTLDLDAFTWSYGEVPNYTAPCKAEDLLSQDEIKHNVKERLREDGFDITNLP